MNKNTKEKKKEKQLKIDNKNIFIKNFCDGLRPQKPGTVTDWADENRVLDSSTSAAAGKYQSSKTPYGRAIMDSLGTETPYEKVIWIAGAQVSKSETGNNWIGYLIDRSPGPIMIVQPTSEMAKKFSKQRIDPMINNCKVLKNKVASKKSRENSNTVMTKDFKGGILNLVGASSAVSLRSSPIKYLFLDEVDGYPLDVDGEGSPVALVEKRAGTFSRSKTYMTSTPKDHESSVIQKEFEQGDMSYYFVPCPHCKSKQVLKFPNLKFEVDINSNISNQETIYYECEFCKHKIKEHNKTWMLENGEWIATNTNNFNKKIKSFHISSLYSPIGWKSWGEIADEFLRAKNDPLKLKTFINTVLGETFKNATFKPNHLELYERREDYKFYELNEEIVYLTAGVDVQDNRLCIIVNGWGKDLENWVVLYQEILGSPGDPQTWKQLKSILNRDFKHKTGCHLNITHCAIDTGGHFTSEVYDFVRRNSEQCIAVKGASSSSNFTGYVKTGKDVDVNIKTGETFEQSLKLHLINTTLAKKTIYKILNYKDYGPGFVHFSKDLDVPFFEMLTSEIFKSRVVNGVIKDEFHKPSGVRNESLDCFVYSYSIAYAKGVHTLYGKEYERIYNTNINKKLEKEGLLIKKDLPKEEPKKNTNEIYDMYKKIHSKPTVNKNKLNINKKTIF